jgi:uncharacterized protein YndB with AHSA1/START domain
MAIEDAAVRREIVLPVDRQTAWSALTDPEELATWLADEVELEIEPGAEGSLRWADGERCPVVVEEVVERRRIVLRCAEVDGPETLVEFVLDDMPEGTRLVVVELPVVQLEVVGQWLAQGPGVLGGPQMVAALA